VRALRLVTPTLAAAKGAGSDAAVAQTQPILHCCIAAEALFDGLLNCVLVADMQWHHSGGIAGTAALLLCMLHCHIAATTLRRR
jgi:hypothetical protein